MVATVLVVLFVGALLVISIRQGAHRRSNLETSLAMSAAFHNLEKLRSVPFATLLSLNGVGFDVPGIDGSPTGGLLALPGDPDGLPGMLTVVDDKPSTGAKLYRIAATVVWKGVSTSRTLRFESLIAERR